MPTYTSGAINEVLIGTGVLYVADRTTSSLAYPSDDGSGAWGAVDTAKWRDIGYSEDGWTLEMDRTFEDILVAEEVDPIKTIKTAQEARLMGELSQASLKNLSIAMGQADGHVSENEVIMIEDIARIFGLNQTQINGIKESRKSSDKLNPYIVLESKPDDSLEEIRKRYIKLSKEHHPDLLLSKGVPQEVIDESKAKMRAVNSAWDQIQKLKN